MEATFNPLYPPLTSSALYHTTSFFLFYFRTKTHFYPTSITPSGLWTTGLKTLRFTIEFNSTWIVFFHFFQIVSSLTFFDRIWFNTLVFPNNIKCYNIYKNIIDNLFFSVPSFSCKDNLLRYHHFHSYFEIIAVYEAERECA